MKVTLLSPADRKDCILPDTLTAHLCGTAYSSSSAATATENQMEEASITIISALDDHAVRVVRSVADNPGKMMAKLDERYDSKSTAKLISTIVELFSVKFSNV